DDEERDAGMARSGSQSKDFLATSGASGSVAALLNLRTRSLTLIWRRLYQPLSLENDLHFAHLAHVAALRPLDFESPPVTDDTQAPVGHAPHDGGHRRAGRARAGGARVAHAALPEAHAQLGARGYGNELDVRAPREEGMPLQQGSHAREERVVRGGVEEDRAVG